MAFWNKKKKKDDFWAGIEQQVQKRNSENLPERKDSFQADPNDFWGSVSQDVQKRNIESLPENKRLLQVEPVEKIEKATFKDQAKGAGLSLAKGFMQSVKTGVDMARFGGNLAFRNSEKSPLGNGKNFEDSIIGKGLKWSSDQFDFAINTAQEMKPEFIKELEANKIISKVDGRWEINAPNKTQVINQLIEQIPELPTYFAGGGFVKGGVMSLLKNPAIKNIAKKSPALAKAIKFLIKNKEEISQGAVNMPIVSSQTFDESLRTVYSELIKNGMSEEEAMQIAQEEATNAGKGMLPISFFTGIGLGSALSSKGNVFKRGAKGIFSEGVSEAPEETIQAGITSRAVRNAKGEKTSLLKEMLTPEALNAGALGGVTGGVMGGGVSVLSGGGGDKNKESNNKTNIDRSAPDDTPPPPPGDYQFKIQEIAEKIESELGKKQAEDFKKSIEDKTFKDYDDFSTQAEEVLSKIDTKKKIEQNVVEKDEKDEPEDAGKPSDDLKNAVISISEGNFKEAKDVAKKLNEKERKDLELIMDEVYNKADQEMKTNLKKEFDSIRDSLGIARTYEEEVKMIDEEKIPLYEKNKEYEEDNEYLENKKDIDNIFADDFNPLKESLKKLDERKNELLAEKKSADDKKLIQEKIDNIDNERIAIKKKKETYEGKYKFAVGKKIKDIVDEIKKHNKDFKLADHKEWTLADFENELNKTLDKQAKKEDNKDIIIKDNYEKRDQDTREGDRQRELSDSLREGEEPQRDNRGDDKKRSGEMAQRERDVSDAGVRKRSSARVEIRHPKGESFSSVARKANKKLKEEYDFNSADNLGRVETRQDGDEVVSVYEYDLEDGKKKEDNKTVKTPDRESLMEVDKESEEYDPEVKTIEDLERIRADYKKMDKTAEEFAEDISHNSTVFNIRNVLSQIDKDVNILNEELTGKHISLSKEIKTGVKKSSQKWGGNIRSANLLDRKLFAETRRALVDFYNQTKEYKTAGERKEGRGVLDEYFTPKEVIDKTVDLAFQYSKIPVETILEPSAGTGNFLEKVKDKKITAFEINPETAKIMQDRFPNAEVINKPLETLFIDERGNKKKPERKWDMVLGNPPYGKHRGKYKGLGEEPSIAKYEDYFIKKSLELTNEGGIVAMVAPSGFLRGADYYAKKEIAKLGIIVDAYRLPNGIFKGTEVGTDIVIFKKETFDKDTMRIEPRVGMISNDVFFKDNPEKVLGEEVEVSGRFGMEKRIKGDITAVDKIDIEKKEIDEEIKQETFFEDKEIKEEPVEERVPKKIKDLNKKVVLVSNKKRQLINISDNIDKDKKELWKNITATGEIVDEGIIKKYKNDLAFANGNYYISDLYYSGNIYGKLDQLEKDKGNMSVEQYEKQRKGLEESLPKTETLDTITMTPNSDFVRDINLNGVSLLDRFIDYIRDIPYEAFEGSSSWEVQGYIDGSVVNTGDKVRNADIRKKRRRIGNKLFKMFLKEELTTDEQEQIEEKYNRQWNFYKKPDFTKVPLFGKIDKKFKGETLKIAPIQKEGAAFLANNGVGLLGYDVGVGKTLTAIVAINEAIEKGWTKKPLIVVPNAVYKNWIAEIQDLLPNRKINSLNNLGGKFKGDLETLKVEDGSISIATYEALNTIGFRDETYQNLTSGLQDVMQGMGKMTERQKELEKTKIEEIEGKVKRGTKTLNYFEDLGFDHITIDEVHNFKNIFAGAKIAGRGNEFRNVRGNSSIRGMKMYFMTQYILGQNNGRNVFALSATPFTNNPLEIYSILSLMGKRKMEQMGIKNVNTFMTQFVELKPTLVVKADQTLKEEDVVENFYNLQQLQQLVTSYIDFRTGEEAGVKRPDKFKKKVVLKPSKLQVENFDKAQELFNDRDKGGAIVAITELQNISLSPYLSRYYSGTPTAKDFVENSPKINYTMKAIKKIRETKPEIGQVIYIPKGIEYFKLLEQYVIEELGLKKEQVGIIKGGMNIDKKADLQNKFNQGKIKILIGTESVKEGVNLQENSTELHFLHLPWNPTDLLQVEGRVWRQGNKWKNIRIHYPLIENSVDSFIFQKLETKEKRIKNLWSYKGNKIEVGDLDFEEMKLDLITDPVVRVKTEIDQKMKRIELKRAEKKANIVFAERRRDKINQIKEDIIAMQNSIKFDKETDVDTSGEEKKLKKLKKDYKTEYERAEKAGIDPTAIDKTIEKTKQEIEEIDKQEDELREEKDKKLEKAKLERVQESNTTTDYDSLIGEIEEENKTFFVKSKNAKTKLMTEDEADSMREVNFAPHVNVVRGQIMTYEAVEIYRKYFGENERELKIFERITNENGIPAWGVSTQKMTAFIENPKESTPYHEAVHDFIRMYLPEKRYQELMVAIEKKKIRNKDGSKMTDYQKEEWLADQFILHVKEGLLNKRENIFVRAFRWLVERIKFFIGKEDKIKKFFNEIEQRRRFYIGKKHGGKEDKFQLDDELINKYKEMLISKKYKVDEALSKVAMELDLAEAGKRIFLEGEYGSSKEVIGVSSSFPKWMPEGTRSRKMIDKVMPLFKNIESIKIPFYEQQKELVFAILEKIDEYAGINTEEIRKKLYQQYAEYPESLTTIRGELKISKLIKDAYFKIYKEELKIDNQLRNAEVIEEGARMAFTEGKKLQRQADRSHWTKKIWSIKKELLEKKNNIVAKYRAKETKREDLRKLLKDLVEGLPIETRRKILSQKRVFNINERVISEIVDSVEQIRIKFVEEQMLGRAKQIVVAKIVMKNLKKTENLRRAMGFPPIRKMNMDQVKAFTQAINEAHFKDIFLTQRQLETIKNTELDGIKTTREVKEKLAERLGVPVESVENIKVNALDRLRYDTALAERNPFYKVMVEDTFRELLPAEEKYIETEKLTNDLIKKARQSRKRSLLDRLIPTDKIIFEYLESENKEELAKDMTPEELEAAEFIKEEYEKMRDYLLENEMMNKHIENYITHIRRGFFETWKDDGLVVAFKEILQQQKLDEAMFNILSDTGEILPLEKFFKYSMKRTGELKPTNNVAKAFLVYKKAFETKVALDAIMPKLDVYVSALTPDIKTPRGLEADRSLKKFFNAWMNNKKGRPTDFGGVIPVGGKLDISLRLGRAFTTMLDLGLNIPLGIASVFGEQVTNFVMLGVKKDLIGSKRILTKKGRKIINKYENFIGKSIWEEFSQASNDFADKTQTALFALFAQSTRLANEQFLLGSLTEEEFKSGVIDEKRLAKLKLEMGRFRVVSDVRSITGSTSLGNVLTQYKTWAIPILRTTIKDIATLKKSGIKSREAQELLRITVFTSLMVLAVASMDDDDEDKSFLAEIKRKVIRESLTLIGALNPTLFLSEPRLLAFLIDLGKSLTSLATLEQYKTTKKGKYQKGDLTAPEKLKRTITPKMIKQFDK